jgi:protein-S-isoprenylcysteine O-methyltransferase Ste14
VALSFRFVVRAVLLAAFGPALLFLAAGDIHWWMGWVFAIFTFVYTVFSRLSIMRKNPDLIAERIGALGKNNVEPWDRALVLFLGVVMPTATVLLAGLDRRFRWSPEFPLWLQAAAYPWMTLGASLAQWAALENPFFSAVVRIQADRKQRVVMTGPYRTIRHPGYAGGLLFHLLIPVALGSLWAFLPVSVNAVLTIVRTSLEDRTLRKKLSGYREYAEITRKRLIPGVW